MKLLFWFKSFRYGLVSKESAVVVLAFALTVGVYGFVVLNYFSSLTAPPSTHSQFTVRSVFLNYYDGGVWRAVVQVGCSSPMDFRLSNVSVGVSVDGVQLPVFIGDAVQVGGDRYVLGGLSPFLASGKVLVSKVSSASTTVEFVDFFVYVDQGNRLNIVVDDDLDGVLDDNYLVRFSSNVSSAYELNYYDDVSLAVGRGITLPVNYLDLIATLSIRPNPAIKVLLGDTAYLIKVSDILTNLRGVAVTAWLSGKDLRLDVNEYVYITLLLPSERVAGSSDLSIDLIIGGVKVLSKTYKVPKGLTGSGTLMMS